MIKVPFPQEALISLPCDGSFPLLPLLVEMCKWWKCIKWRIDLLKSSQAGLPPQKLTTCPTSHRCSLGGELARNKQHTDEIESRREDGEKQTKFVPKGHLRNFISPLFPVYRKWKFLSSLLRAEFIANKPFGLCEREFEVNEEERRLLRSLDGVEWEAGMIRLFGVSK